MLVELGVVEQRYRAVPDVLNEGVSVTEMARRCGAARQDGACVEESQSQSESLQMGNPAPDGKGNSANETWWTRRSTPEGEQEHAEFLDKVEQVYEIGEVTAKVRIGTLAE